MRKPYFVFSLSLGIGLLLTWIYLPVLTKYRELKGQEDRMSSEIAALDKKISDLEQEKSLLKSDVSYLEKVIRDELGFVRPGETVLKFVPDGKVPPSPVPAKEQAQNSRPPQ